MKNHEKVFLNEKVNKPHLHKDESSTLYNWYGKPNEISKPGVVLLVCATIVVIIGLVVLFVI